MIMELITFQGLNCYHDSLVTLANHFDVDYIAAFSSLWAECDFRYDPLRDVFLSKRIITNFSYLGMALQTLVCEREKDVEACLSLLNNGDFFIVGADAFNITWSKIYRIFYGAHYFIVRYSSLEEYLCYDATYNKDCIIINHRELISLPYEIIIPKLITKNSPPCKIIDDAYEFLAKQAEICYNILNQIENLTYKEPKEIINFAKYISAMINNRYLYKCYLNRYISSISALGNVFNPEYFSSWNALKNALYKVAVGGKNEMLCEELCEIFTALMEKEKSFAQDIILAKNIILAKGIM